MSKFTPGPWKYRDECPSNGYMVYRFENFSGSFQRWASDKTKDADAKLVVKAPDMYSQLWNLLNVLITLYDEKNPFAHLAEKYIKEARDLLKEIDAE